MVKTEMKQVVSRIFHGSIPALATYLINSDEIKADEIKAIKKLIDEKESQLKG